MKVLMIINEFPPTGESGVQRALKFVKYLSKAGHEVHVITPKKPVKSILDYTLCNDIPKSVIVHYTPSLGIKGKARDAIAKTKDSVKYQEPSLIKSIIWNIIKLVNDFIFPYDKQIGWVPFAIYKASKVIKKERIEKVFITSYPFSAQLIGLKLKKKFGSRIFYVADYRDSWQFEPKLSENVNRTRLRKIQKLDNMVLKKCDYFTVATEQILEEYFEIIPELKSKSTVILNGFDEDDFNDIVPMKFDKFTFFYMGKIYDYKRSPLPILETLHKVENSMDFQFISIGTIPKSILNDVNSKFSFFKYLGYKSHKQALEMGAGADILVLIVNDDIKSKGVITGKVFEYIRLNKPILAICPKDGVLEKLINDYKLGVATQPNNEAMLLEAVNRIMNYNIIRDDESIHKFSRESQTQQLIEVLSKHNEKSN